eukprot:TRINITY_DN1649_c0_g1_i1.p1 TRINITY_DN1649_c0_g1~~TRINITY_DN1649_c0_g1_i1.p1  ORF type:complete len:765 (+),score=193.33 TRINITY_DN1649_c0_g1_i1:151-2445(+)
MPESKNKGAAVIRTKETNFIVKLKIGKGSFGEIYLVEDKSTGKEYALKAESDDYDSPQLGIEKKVYDSLRGKKGVPQVMWYGNHNDHICLIMDLLGPSLEELYNYCSRKISIRSVLRIGMQLIERIQDLHEAGYVHRDIKPDNFLIGLGKSSKIIHVIDLGLSKRYRSRSTGKHIPLIEGKGLTGTARYASINAHLGIESSRRDDLESIGYVLIYFFKGELPWQGLPGKTKSEKYGNICQTKQDYPIKELCRGLPDEIKEYMEYCRDLKFTETPDYEYIYLLFEEALKNYPPEGRDYFDWTIIKRAKLKKKGREKQKDREDRRRIKEVKRQRDKQLEEDMEKLDISNNDRLESTSGHKSRSRRRQSESRNSHQQNHHHSKSTSKRRSKRRRRHKDRPVEYDEHNDVCMVRDEDYSSVSRSPALETRRISRSPAHNRSRPSRSPSRQHRNRVVSRSPAGRRDREERSRSPAIRQSRPMTSMSRRSRHHSRSIHSKRKRSYGEPDYEYLTESEEEVRHIEDSDSEMVEDRNWNVQKPKRTISTEVAPRLHHTSSRLVKDKKKPDREVSRDYIEPETPRRHSRQGLNKRHQHQKNSTLLHHSACDSICVDRASRPPSRGFAAEVGVDEHEVEGQWESFVPHTHTRDSSTRASTAISISRSPLRDRKESNERRHSRHERRERRISRGAHAIVADDDDEEEVPRTRNSYSMGTRKGRNGGIFGRNRHNSSNTTDSSQRSGLKIPDAIPRQRLVHTNSFGAMSAISESSE